MVITKKARDSDECKQKISTFLDALEIPFQDISIYILAFIHRSIVNERPDFAPEHNERLEFLGDAVLELVTTDNLYKDFPEKNEGQLTDIRSALVRWRNLATISKKLWLQEYLFLGNGEELSGGRENEYILANTLEAFLGAIYLDTWFIVVKKFIDSHIYATLTDSNDSLSFKDFKSLVQEFAQAHYEITPTYKLHADSWPDHNKIFEVGIYLTDTLIGIWKWSSKKKAQEQAAQNAYEKKENWYSVNI